MSAPGLREDDSITVYAKDILRSKRVQTTVVQRPSQQFGRSTLSSSCNLLFVQASKTHFLSFNASDNDYSARTPVTFTSQRVTCPWFSLKPIVNEFNVIHNNYG